MIGEWVDKCAVCGRDLTDEYSNTGEKNTMP
jgi:hypothetical protein